MRWSGHKTQAVFKRYDIYDEKADSEMALQRYEAAQKAALEALNRERTAKDIVRTTADVPQQGVLSGGN
jgi:hypothetical protein